MEHDPENIALKLSKDLRKNNLLELAIQKLYDGFKLIPKIGAEIEFYLAKPVEVEIFSKISGFSIKKEKGLFQYEIDLEPSTDLIKYVEYIEESMARIAQSARSQGNEAIFLSKPFLEDYGSSIHFHLNFLCPKNEYIDYLLEPAAQSLCFFMERTLPAFLPKISDYARIWEGFDAPTHICYGNNNRTVAVRMPDAFPKRLEHRLSSPLCDPYAALFAIIKSVYLGFKRPETLIKIEKIYGKASDEQYGLIALPRNIYDALQAFDESFFIEV